MSDSDNIQLGMGSLGIKTYVAATYASGFTDVGYTDEKGGVFNYKGSIKDFKAGNVKGIVKKIMIDEAAALELGLQEFSPENFCRALGLNPATDIDDDTVNHVKTIYIGGGTTSNYISVEFKVTFDVTGLFARIVLCKCLAAPELKVDLKPNDGIVLPFKAEALVDDAAGDTNGKYGFIEFKYATA